MQLRQSVLVTNPLPEDDSIDADLMEEWIKQALAEAKGFKGLKARKKHLSCLKRLLNYRVEIH